MKSGGRLVGGNEEKQHGNGERAQELQILESSRKSCSLR